MKTKSIVAEKSFEFAKQIIEVYKHLKFDRKEFELSKQLVKSGTSIGDNIEEALGAQSDRDFLSKISISYKEARECKYWIRLLSETDLLPRDQSKKLIPQIDEISRMLASTQFTMQKKISKQKTNSYLKTQDA